MTDHSPGYPSVQVNRKAAGRVASGHPWIFVSDVIDRGAARGGEAVRVTDHRGKPLGMAHYSDASQITLRMLTSRVASIDRAFYRERLQAALAYRQTVVTGTEAYRLVFGEADLLPALVVDRYSDVLVVQTLNQGMDRAQPLIVEALQELLSPAAIAVRNDVAIRTKENLPLETAVIAGTVPPRVSVQLNGLRFDADLLHGQKTGIYLDQRENYQAARRHAHGRALDCFTSTGGFALHMAASCEAVEGVDSSEAALQTAAAHREVNGIGNLTFRQADVFDLLAGFAASGRRFDTIVLDPPAFTKSRSAVEGALRGYREINQRALRLLPRGGVLITCSCSQHISEAMLLQVVAEAALDAGRTLRVRERRTQAADHPILLTVPETLYLKCLVLEVL